MKTPHDFVLLEAVDENVEQRSVVLPFALPAPEFASDLTRALKAPALAALLSRHASQQFQPLEGAARVLPHGMTGWVN